MSDYETVTPEMDDDELVGKEVATARSVESGGDNDSQGFMKIKYIDDEVVFYKNVNYNRESHGQEKRETWNQQVAEGYYKIVGDDFVDEVQDVQQNGRLEELKEVKGVGDSSLEELRKNDYENLSDVTDEDPSELIKVPKIGKTTIERIRDQFGGLEGKIIYPSQNRTSSSGTTTENKEEEQDTEQTSDEQESDEEEEEDDGWSQLVEADDDDWSMNQL